MRLVSDDKNKFIDELPVNSDELFEDNKDLYKYLYQFDKNQKNDNLILAYLQAEPKKKTFVRNQRKLMTLITSFLIATDRALNRKVIFQNLTYDFDNKRLCWVTNENETQNQARDRIKQEIQEIKKVNLDCTTKAVDFLYNIVESIAILERNRNDNYFASEGFGNNSIVKEEQSNLLLEKTKDKDEESKKK